MADLVITAANVLAGSGATVDRSHNAGATITAGQSVYLDPTTSTYLLSDDNSGTVAARTVSGIALNGASSGQPVGVLTSGPITIGATTVVGESYYLSANPGGIAPKADLGAGQYPSLIGFGTSVTQILVNIDAAGVSL